MSQEASAAKPKVSVGIFVVSAAALTLGMALFTIDEAEGLSYLSGEPEACVNCHVMRDQFEAWNHSSHREWATCNDCHTPHTFVRGYYSKAISGWNHSVAFTTGNFPEPIVIGDRSRRIVVENCVDCHEGLASQILGSGDTHDPDEVRCLTCHSDVGH